MTDTNSFSQLAQAAPQVQNALNAWHVVALGAGAYLAHAYHSIKAAGGIKNILCGLWDGGADCFGVPPSGGLPEPAKAGTPNAQAALTGASTGAPASQLSTNNSQP